MSRKRLGLEPSVRVSVRIPGEWHKRLEQMADPQNPVKELVRTALKRFLKM